MDSDDPTIESKCENLMNIVLESRKRFGKNCVEYHQKVLLMENKLLNLQVETVSNYRFKFKNPIASVEEDSCKDLDDFLVEVTEKQNRIESVKKNLRNAQDVILQLQGDNVGRKLRAPLTAEAMLAKVKAREV